MNIDTGGHGGVKTRNINRRVRVVDENGNEKLVDKNDPKYISGEYKHINAVRNKPSLNRIRIVKNNADKLICKDDLQKYLDDGWELGTKLKGRKSPTTGLKHIKKNDKEIMVSKDDLQKYLDDGWELGRICSPCKDKILIKKSGVDKYCSKDDLQKYLDDGWELGGRTRNKGRVMVVDKNGEVLSIYKDDPRWVNKEVKSLVSSKGSSVKGYVYIHLNGNEKRVNKNKLTQYIESGWKLGRSPINKSTHIIKDGNSLFIYKNPELLQKYLDDGWIIQEE